MRNSALDAFRLARRRFLADGEPDPHKAAQAIAALLR